VTATVTDRALRYRQFNNKPPKDWGLGYELVVSFAYGLNDNAIARIAGLKNFDTGTDPRTRIRDLMFPCGTDKELAYTAANRLWRADHFGALRIRISYPDEHEGKDTFTPWYSMDRELIERVKHRKKALIVKVVKQRKRKAA
jgi:hypothetical protein